MRQSANANAGPIRCLSSSVTGLRVFTCRDGSELLAQRALQARQVDGLDQVQATGSAPLHHHAAVQQELHALQSRDFIPLPLVQPRGLQTRQQHDVSIAMAEAWVVTQKLSQANEYMRAYIQQQPQSQTRQPAQAKRKLTMSKYTSTNKLVWS